MFSPMKLILLVAIIAAVWFAFKAIGRVRQAKANTESVDYEDHRNIDDRR